MHRKAVMFNYVDNKFTMHRKAVMFNYVDSLQCIERLLCLIMLIVYNA